MRYFALVLSVLFCACVPQELEVDRSKSAIRNGTAHPTLIEDSPSVRERLVWIHDAGNPDTVICTGLLMSDRVVLTAGHCLSNPYNLAVSRSTDLVPTQYAVRTVVSHDALDVGLLSIHMNIDTSNPLLLHREALEANWLGQRVEAAGFGEDYDLTTLVALKFAALTIVELDEFSITVDGLGAKGLCFGDSGAPVFSKNSENEPVLIGISSHGDASCLDRDYLTRIDKVFQWLEAHYSIQNLDDDALCMRGEYPLAQCLNGTLITCQDNQISYSSCSESGELCSEEPEGSQCIRPALEHDSGSQHPHQDYGPPLSELNSGMRNQGNMNGHSCHNGPVSPINGAYIVLILAAAVSICRQPMR